MALYAFLCFLSLGSFSLKALIVNVGPPAPRSNTSSQLQSQSQSWPAASASSPPMALPKSFQTDFLGTLFHGRFWLCLPNWFLSSNLDLNLGLQPPQRPLANVVPPAPRSNASSRLQPQSQSHSLCEHHPTGFKNKYSNPSPRQSHDPLSPRHNHPHES